MKLLFIIAFKDRGSLIRSLSAATLVPCSLHKMPNEATETIPATEQELPQLQAETGSG